MKRPELLKPEKVPKGWFSRRDLEKKWGLSTPSVNKILAEGIQAKSILSKEFRIRTATGKVYPVPHYRQK
jgi:hypothetical protein